MDNSQTLNLVVLGVQALAAVVITMLTGVLVAITAYYAWATNELRRVAQRDYEHKTRPAVTFSINRITGKPDTGEIRARVVARNAPATLKNLKVFFFGMDGYKAETIRPIECEFNVAGNTVQIGDENGLNFVTSLFPKNPTQSDLRTLGWVAQCAYTDWSEKTSHKTILLKWGGVAADPNDISRTSRDLHEIAQEGADAFKYILTGQQEE